LFLKYIRGPLLIFLGILSKIWPVLKFAARAIAIAMGHHDKHGYVCLWRLNFHFECFGGLKSWVVFEKSMWERVLDSIQYIYVLLDY